MTVIKASPDHAAHREAVRQRFGPFMEGRGYARHAPGPLVPEHDKTVLFTGAAISTLKPYIKAHKIPEGGFWIVQQNLRAHNLSSLEAGVGRPLDYASYFCSIGLLGGPDHFPRLARDTVHFLEACAAVPRDRLLVRGSTTDRDLVEAFVALGLSDRIELDAREHAYYRHRFGIPGVEGRNVNIAVLDATGTPRDLGNVILISDPSGPIAVETALGLEVLTAHTLGLPSALHAARIADALEVTSSMEASVADAVSSSLAIIEAGVVPVVTRRGRILRRYLQCIDPLRRKAGVSTPTLEVALRRFAQMQFGDVRPAELALRYVLAHEAESAQLSGAPLNRRLAKITRWW